MSPFPRQRRRRVSVEELLLRTTGDDSVPDHAVRHRRARLAGGREKRDVLRLSAGAAVVVAAVCLTVFAAMPKPSSPEPVAAPPLSLPTEPPATTLPETTPSPSTSASNPVTFTAVPVSKPRRSVAATTASASTQVISCTVRFTVTDSWPGGFTASVGITNTGGSAVSPWTLTWTFAAGQQITHGWDGEYAQSGDRVTVRPASYNPAIAASATTNIGFNGSYSSTNPAPTGFALNGTRCGH